MSQDDAWRRHLYGYRKIEPVAADEDNVGVEGMWFVKFFGPIGAVLLAGWLVVQYLVPIFSK